MNPVPGHEFNLDMGSSLDLTAAARMREVESACNEQTDVSKYSVALQSRHLLSDAGRSPHVCFVGRREPL